MSSDRVFRPNEEQLELLKRWYAPDVSKAVSQETTNAFGLTAQQMNERQQVAVVEEVAEPESEVESAQLTAQDLDEIRQSAQQEGYDAGFSKGQSEGVLAGHDDGYEQGLAQGQAEGHQQAMDAGQAEITATVALLTQLVAQLAAPLHEQEQQLELALVDLALDVAKKVIHTEVTQSHQPIIAAITDGIKVLGRNEPITVQLHPQDIESVLSVWPQDQLDKRGVELEPDLTMTLGSCHIESKMSSVSLALSERIEQVFSDFYARPAPQIERVEPEFLKEGSEALAQAERPLDTELSDTELSQTEQAAQTEQASESVPDDSADSDPS